MKKLCNIVCAILLFMCMGWAFPACQTANPTGRYRFYVYTMSTRNDEGEWQETETYYVQSKIACIGTCISGLYTLQKESFMLDVYEDGSFLWVADNRVPSVPLSGGCVGTWEQSGKDVRFILDGGELATAKMDGDDLVFTVAVNSVNYQYTITVRKEQVQTQSNIEGFYTTETLLIDGKAQETQEDYFTAALYEEGRGILFGDIDWDLAIGRICTWSAEEGAVEISTAVAIYPFTWQDNRLSMSYEKDGKTCELTLKKRTNA